MVRDRRLSERQLGGDVTNGARATCVEQFEDLKTRWMSERLGDRYGFRAREPARFDRVFIKTCPWWRLSIHDSLRSPSTAAPHDLDTTTVTVRACPKLHSHRLRLSVQMTLRVQPCLP
jgi:hypothetical protein